MSKFDHPERPREGSRPSERQKKSLFKRQDKGGGDLSITKPKEQEGQRLSRPRGETPQERQIFKQLDRETVKNLEEGLEDLRDSRERFLLKQSQRKDLLPSGRERARQQLEALRQKRAKEKPTSG